jgi:hypothetical protein
VDVSGNCQARFESVFHDRAHIRFRKRDIGGRRDFVGRDFAAGYPYRDNCAAGEFFI